MARACGVKVIEFSFGMGPRLFTIHGQQTDYSLKLLPIGGSCQMKDEDEVGHDPDSFAVKTPWQRFLIVIAGPMFNFLLAFIAAIILVTFVGSDRPVISSVISSFPAEEVGIEGGDEIIKLNNRRIHLYREVSLYNLVHNGMPVDVTVKRNGNLHTYHVKPKYDDETGRMLIGMTAQNNTKQPENIIEAICYSYYELRYNILMVVDSFVYLFSGHMNTDSVMGPVGIAGTISETVEEVAPYGAKILILTMIEYILLFSTNLGAMNLIPFPALDGGRLLFIIYELIFQKPVKKEIEAYIHLVGFGILMILMLLVAFNDVGRFFK